MEVKIEFVRTHPAAILPSRNHSDDSGLDVFAVEKSVVLARSAIIVPVGLKLGYITPGYWIRVESRSGLQFKHNIAAFNGIIDQNYRGDLGIRLINNSDTNYTISAGDRIAQFVIYPLILATPSFGLSQSTDRGEKGFGSSGN